MNKDKKSLLIRYGIAFGVGALLVFVVFCIKGFFTDDVRTNLQILTDAFFASGVLMMLFSGLMFCSGEGAFLGIGFIMRKVVRTLIPFLGRDTETYAHYRERKSGSSKPSGALCVLITGAVYFFVSLVFLFLWYFV